MLEATAAGRERVQAHRGRNALSASRLLPRHFSRWSADERRSWYETNMRSTSGENSISDLNERTATVGVEPRDRAELDNVIEGFRGSNRTGLAQNSRNGQIPTSNYDSLVLPAAGILSPTRFESSDQSRSTHPLSRSWRPTSPPSLTSSRSASPTSDGMADAWEVMQTTITPDETLPSADSSFTSTIVSNSFSAEHATTDTTPATSYDGNDINAMTTGRRFTRRGSVSSLDGSVPTVVCEDEEDGTNGMMLATGVLAEAMYATESRTEEGRGRIATHQAAREEEGMNRYAWDDESDNVEVGLRLIDEALASTDGVSRLVRVQNAVMARSLTPSHTTEGRSDTPGNIILPFGTARLPFLHRHLEQENERRRARVARVHSTQGSRGGPLNSHPVLDQTGRSGNSHAADSPPPEPNAFLHRLVTAYSALGTDRVRWAAVLDAMNPRAGGGENTIRRLEMQRIAALMEANGRVPTDVWNTYIVIPAEHDRVAVYPQDRIAASLSHRQILRNQGIVGQMNDADSTPTVPLEFTVTGETGMDRRVVWAERFELPNRENGTQGRREDGTQPATELQNLPGLPRGTQGFEATEQD